MINLDDRVILYDAISLNVFVIENKEIVTKTFSKEKEKIAEVIYRLCETQAISNVFIKAFAPINREKLVRDIEGFGKIYFSKIFDKIHIYVI